jgi:hypothetical protein
MFVCRAFLSIALVDIPLDNTPKDRNTPGDLKTIEKGKGRRDENLNLRKNENSLNPVFLNWFMYVIGSSFI